MSKKDTELKVIEETSKIIKDIEKGFYEILANHTMKVCIAYEDELDKYKRALGIFERLLNDKFVYAGFDDRRFIIDGFIDITDEEHELLEGLMKDENC